MHKLVPFLYIFGLQTYTYSILINFKRLFSTLIPPHPPHPHDEARLLACSLFWATFKLFFAKRLSNNFLFFKHAFFEKNRNFPFLVGLLALLGFLALFSLLGWLAKLARALVFDFELLGSFFFAKWHFFLFYIGVFWKWFFF